VLSDEIQIFRATDLARLVREATPESDPELGAYLRRFGKVIAEELLGLRMQLDRLEPLIQAAEHYAYEMDRPPEFNRNGLDVTRERAVIALLDAALEVTIE
jgi:hypothetical protein